MKESEVLQAWQEAATDLNIKIQTPFTLLTADKKELTFQLLIEDFGSRLGTLTLSMNDMDDLETPEKHGYYCSALNLLSYDKYDRGHFVDTLTDWGFYGNEADKPNWYVGHVYGRK